MRLNHGDQLAFDNRARSLQHCCYLNRMMRVIVDDGDSVPLTGLSEAPLYSLEIG